MMSPEEALLSTGGGGPSSMVVVTDDRHWETFHTRCEIVPHRSTPQRLLVVLGRVEICGSGAAGLRVALWRERVWRTS